MRLSRREQLLRLGRTALGKLVDLALGWQAEVQALRRQIKELQARLARNSTNSHQPPATLLPATT